MAHPQALIPDGSTQIFQNMNQNDIVIDPNYSYHRAFYRAMKVLFISYPEYGPNSPPSYQLIDEFIHEMQSLYDVPVVNQILLDAQMQLIRNENISVAITVKRFRGRDQITGPKVVLNNKGRVARRNLDVTNEIQTVNPFSIGTNFNAIKVLRTDPQNELIIRVEGDNWVQSDQPLNELIIAWARTHPEGYEQWFDFGRGVQLLINLEYKVRNEPNMTASDVSVFHLNTIYKMLERRLREYGSRTRWTDLGHQLFALKSRVTHRRPLVDPQTNDMFWPTLNPNTVGALRRRHPSTVKFVEFQTGWNSREDFEDKVCLCCEWCNWNAFFYYNPMYRFLLVRHHQLYMQNKTNLPNMYLCISVILGCSQLPGKFPIFQLIGSANDYRRKYYDNYYLKDPNFRLLYDPTVPNGPVMNALAYNKLRHQMDVTKLCHELDANPFADICIENLMVYYKVMIELHLAQTLYQPDFITDPKEWYRSLDRIGRNNYCIYIKDSYEKLMAEHRGGYDYLFTIDYEYSSRLARTDEGTQIMSWRATILKRSQMDSPFNFRITMNDFLSAFASIYKFLSKVEPMLPQAHKTRGLEQVYNCYRQLDDDFETYQRINKSFIYQIESNDPEFQTLEQNFNAFYTLKLYFYLFEIQKHCIQSLIKRNKRLDYERDQVCKIFTFIWRNSLIEQQYLNAFGAAQPLFEFDVRPFEVDFDEFYDNFWGKAYHETNIINNFLEYIDSGYREYQRLYYWWKNDGNEKTKFKQIIDKFIISLKKTLDSSEAVILNIIMPSIVVLSNRSEYYVEVFDQLVYYTAKGNCSAILCTTAKLLRKMHCLQTEALYTAKVNYSFSKPGWVPLFRTMYEVLDQINRVQTDYITFDDEFERIANTCDQTKQMAKDLYRQFYNKLVDEWVEEILEVVLRTSQVSSNKVAEFLLLNLTVGQSFMAFFCNDFRWNFADFRKWCISCLDKPPNPAIVQQVHLRSVFNVFKAYFRDRNAIQSAMPFLTNPWMQHLAPILIPIDQMTGQQLNIDLNAANV